MDFKQFLASGKTIITDTMAPKSELPKVKKKISVEKEQTTIAGAILDPLENLIKRVVDEDVKKLEVVEVFKKIIDQEEAKI
jgi:hypothetical protein